jgi:hypothetical protein
MDNLLAIRRARVPANYSPPFSLLMGPWIILSFRTDALLWLLFMLAVIEGSFACCWYQSESATAFRIARIAFVVLPSQPMTEDPAPGQIKTSLLSLASDLQPLRRRATATSAVTCRTSIQPSPDTDFAFGPPSSRCATRLVDKGAAHGC